MQTEMNKMIEMFNRRWVVELAKQDPDSWDLRAWLMSNKAVVVYSVFGRNCDLLTLLAEAEQELAGAEKQHRLRILQRTDLFPESIAHHQRIVAEMDAIIAAAEF